MFHLLQTYVVFQCFMLVLRVLEVYSESYGGMARALGEGVRRAEDRQMGRTACLESCGRDILVLIQAPRSRLHGEKRGQGEE
jgi:hypothetical protein